MTSQRPNYVPGHGPSNAKIAIVGEAPGAEEDRQREPFVGESGQLLNKILYESGISRNEVYITNVCKYRPPNNDLELLSHIGIKLEDQIEQLYEEISRLRPNIIIALGNTSLISLTNEKGIINYRGSILPSKVAGIKVIPSIHPANIIRYNHAKNKEDKNKAQFNSVPYFYRHIMPLDFIKAKRESEYPDIRTPKRNIEIIKSAYQLYKALESYPNVTEWTVDIENPKQIAAGIPVCLSLSPNKWHAIVVPLWHDLYNLKIPHTELAAIYQILSQFFSDPRIKLINQNIKFDLQKLISPMRFLNWERRKVVADTAWMSKIVHPEFPTNLAFLTSIWTDEPYYKDEGKEFHPKKDKIEKFLVYNGKDSTVTYEVYEELDKELTELGLRDFYYNYQHQLFDMYYELEDEGMLYDLKRKRELELYYREKIRVISEELKSLLSFEVNVMSPKQLMEMMYGFLELPNRGSADEDTIVGLLGFLKSDSCKQNTKINRELCEQVLQKTLLCKGYRTSLSRYVAPEPDYDGYHRSSYKGNGTETGRSSTSKYESPVRPTPSGFSIQTTSHTPTGKEIKSMLIIEPGFFFLSADLSQAQARIVAVLSNDFETLELFNTTDIHSLTASWIFGGDFKEYKSKFPEKRFIGKTIRHAGNFGAKARRAMLTINSDANKYGIPVAVSEKQSKLILDIFHKKSPKVEGVFHKEIEAALIANNRVLYSPFGRRRQFFGKFDHNLLGEAFAYIPQATDVDHLRMAMLRIRDQVDPNDFRFCKEAHDSFVAKIKIGYEKEVIPIIRKEMHKPINFSKCTLSRNIDLVIPCEISIGKHNYKDMKVVKD